MSKPTSNLVVVGKIRKVRPHPLGNGFQLAEFNQELQVVIGPWFKEGALGILFCNEVLMPPHLARSMSLTNRFFTYNDGGCIVGNFTLDNIFSEGWFWSNECEVDGKNFVPSWWINTNKWKEGEEICSYYNLTKGYVNHPSYKIPFVLQNIKNWKPETSEGEEEEILPFDIRKTYSKKFKPSRTAPAVRKTISKAWSKDYGLEMKISEKPSPYCGEIVGKMDADIPAQQYVPPPMAYDDNFLDVYPSNPDPE